MQDNLHNLKRSYSINDDEIKKVENEKSESIKSEKGIKYAYDDE